MKTIYFVRHGESEGNVGLVRQGHHSSLTEKGMEQARFIANRAKKLPVEVLVSSSMKRAVETAEIIGKEIGMAPELSDLFIERRRPSVQIGKAKDSADSVDAELMILENFTKPGYRYSDEENFDDLKERAGRALIFLENRKEENFLVVTHGFFLRIFVARALFGSALSSQEGDHFARTFHMENTGLSVLKYDEKGKYWWLWVWNDYAHLG